MNNIKKPIERSKLYIHGDDEDGLAFVFARKKPNFWFRYWQFYLLGWIWRDIK